MKTEEMICDEEFIRTKALPVLQEMCRRNISGFSDGEYRYEVERW